MTDLCRLKAQALIDEFQLTADSWWLEDGEETWIFLDRPDQRETHSQFDRAIDEYVDRLTIDEVFEHLKSTDHNLFTDSMSVAEHFYGGTERSWQDVLTTILHRTIYKLAGDLVKPESIR